MCFEFIHDCTDPLIDLISNLIGVDHYFLACINHLNYFYCTDITLVTKIKDLLINQGIELDKISENELISVVNFPDTKAFQIVHGNKILFNSLQEISQVPF